MSNPGTVNILDFGALPNGYSDNRDAIQAALDFAAANGNLAVEIPPGVWRYGWTFVNTGCDLFGYGDETILYPLNEGMRAVIMRGDGPSLRNIRLLTHHSMRNGSPESAAVLVDKATNFLVENVTVHRSGTVGVFMRAATFGTVRNCTVLETRADGIHITTDLGTAVSHDITVENCRTERCADDGIACVGYNMQQNYNITVQNNTVLHPNHGRGMTMVGARDSFIINNYTEGGTAGNAGIAVIADLDYATAPNNDIMISGNTIKNAGSDLNGPGAIWVMNYYGVNPVYDQHHITIDNNQVYAAPGVGIRITGPNTRDITITNNDIFDPASFPVRLDGNPANVTQSNNLELTLAQYPGDQVTQVQGSDGWRPAVPVSTITLTANGTAASGFPSFGLDTDGLPVVTSYAVSASRSLGQAQVITITARLPEGSKLLEIAMGTDAGDPGRNIYFQGIQVNGVEMLSGEIGLTHTKPVYYLDILPKARSAAELKSEMPENVIGAISVQDIHYVLDTLERKTRQDCVRKSSGIATALASQHGVTFILDTTDTLVVASDCPAGWRCQAFQRTDIQATFQAEGGNVRCFGGYTKTKQILSMATLLVYENSGGSPQVILSGSVGP
jgi:hypothetical protein